jgi:multiple antibiotic resistance protein
MLLWIAFEMVFERRTERRTRSAEEISRQPAEDIAVFPLAIPLLSGPGAITSVMLLMGRYEGQLPYQAAVLLVLALVLALCVLIFLLAEPTERLLGPTATNVISRLLGILLAALAVQYVLDGLVSGLALASS